MTEHERDLMRLLAEAVDHTLAYAASIAPHLSVGRVSDLQLRLRNAVLAMDVERELAEAAAARQTDPAGARLLADHVARDIPDAETRRAVEQAIQAARQGLGALPIAHTGPGYTNAPAVTHQQLPSAPAALCSPRWC
jgi:hypothetical protein